MRFIVTKMFSGFDTFLEYLINHILYSNSEYNKYDLD